MNSYALKRLKWELEGRLKEEEELKKRKLENYKEYKKLLLEKSKLEQTKSVQRYLELIKRLNGYDIDEEKIISMKDEKYDLDYAIRYLLSLESVKEEDTSGIYVFEGSYSKLNYRIDRDTYHPSFNVYWNLELPRPHREYHYDDGETIAETEKVVNIINVPRFENKNIVFDFGKKFDFYGLQQELVGDMLKVGEKEAIKKFTKKYENRRRG